MLNIIIINWNSGTQLSRAISSIRNHHNNLVSSIVVVDNASADDSLACVEKLANLPFDLQIISNTENRGFGAACNQGAALTKGEYLLFLNPDTCISENSLSVSMAFMQQPENAEVGIVGIQLVDKNDQIARSCARFPSVGIFVAQSLGINRLPGLGHLNMHMEDWGHDRTAKVDHVIGAFFFIRRTLFESLGGFDERFFVYLEDLDLSLRAQHAGWCTVFLANAQALHAGGGTSKQVKRHRLFYSLRSRLLYGFKHFKRSQAWAILGVSLGLEPTSRVMFALVRGASRDVVNTLKAYGMLFRDLPNILEMARRP